MHESGLAGGSSPGVKPTTASGSLAISAPDGVAAIAIGGTTVYENGALTGRTVSTDEGFLTATGFNAATGELTYDYNLTAGTTEHDTAATDAQFSRVLAVTVTDADGSVGEGVITVTIVDDEPSTTDITHELHEGDTSPAVGYVLDTDLVAGVVVTGADDGEGASFAWEANQNGKYGTITMNANGSYSYRLDHDNAKVKALTTGETLSEEFKYTYTDADGDTVTGSVNVIIHGKNNGVMVTPGASPAVDDFGLLTGSFLIMAPDGVNTIVIDGVTVYENGVLTGSTVLTDGGSLEVTFFATVTGEVTYSYLGEPFSFDVTVTDADGSEGTCSITVTNGDDGADGTSSATAGLMFALPAEEAEGVASLAMSTEDDASAFSGSLADAGEGGGQNGGGADEPASFHAPAGSGALESCLARFEAPDHAASDGEEMLFAGSGDGLSDGAAPVGLSGEAEGHGSGLMAEALADGAARGLAAGMEGTLSLDALLGSDSGGRSAEALMPDSDALSLTGMDRLDGEGGADGAGRETLLSDASFWSVPSGDACDVAGDLSLETAFIPVENTSADDAAAQQAFLLQNGSG